MVDTVNAGESPSMSSLEVMDLRNNRFTSFPYTAAQVDLLMKTNGETSLNRFGYLFPKLKELLLAENRIEIVYPQMTISTLQKVLLAQNCIVNIENLFCPDFNLSTLILSKNQIRTIPESIGNFTSLKELDFTYNEISRIPESITRLTNLEKLNLLGNNFDSIPMELQSFDYGIVKVMNDSCPDCIIPNLYLGSLHDAQDKFQLKRLAITHIVSVLQIPPLYPKDFQYLSIQLEDEPGVDIQRYFEEAHTFISSALENGNAVLVHCFAGISRSATIVISYLMFKRRMPFREAFAFVRSKRDIVCPNGGFQRQMEEYEKRINITKQESKLLKHNNKNCVIN